ncbi:MAG: hypothetical protein IJ405_08500, partial [Lachnospiraceae bacterium]|nr:hypothetical protein [Lachnospiraceae bacterium]
AWGLGRPIAAIRFVYNQVQGISTPVTPESTSPLQEEGISEILDVGDGDGIMLEGESAVIMFDPYEGVKQASEYLQSQGIPRAYRKQILESFNIETIKIEIAGDNTYGLRFYGGNASAQGRYLFETFSPLTNRQNLALLYEWNSMTGIQQFQVRDGVIMITGTAAAQNDFGSHYVGGAKQWYINNLEDLIRCY